MTSATDSGISDLPIEVLVCIFSLLSVADLGRCAAVCEQWHKIVTGFTLLWKGKRYVSNRSSRECAETRSVLHALPPLQKVLIETADTFAVDISYPCLDLKVTCIGEVTDCPRMKCECLSTGVDVAGGILSCRSTVDFEALKHLRILRTQKLDSWITATYSATYVVGTALGLCPNLTHLCVYADSLSADYLDTMEGLGQLQTLEIECPSLEKLAFLRHCSGTLEQLRLEGCTGLPSQEFTVLGRLRNLQRLQLIDCPRLWDMSVLQQCSHLLRLSIASSQAPDVLLYVSLRRRQLELSIWGLPTDPEVSPVRAVGLRLLTNDLSSALPRLEELGLPSSCIAYLAALRHCPQLRFLSCDFVREPDEPELLNVRALINASST